MPMYAGIGNEPDWQPSYMGLDTMIVQLIY